MRARIGEASVGNAREGKPHLSCSVSISPGCLVGRCVRILVARGRDQSDALDDQGILTLGDRWRLSIAESVRSLPPNKRAFEATMNPSQLFSRRSTMKGDGVHWEKAVAE